MKNRLLLLFFVVFTVAQIQAQKELGPISMEYGEEIQEEKGKIVRIIGEVNGKIYTLANKKKKYYLKIFSSDAMALETFNQIKMPDFKKKELTFEDVQLIGEKLYLFGSTYERKTKTSNLVAIQIMEDGSLATKQTTLFNAKVAKRSQRGGFYFRENFNGNKLLALHASMNEREEYIKYELKLLNEDLGEETAHVEQVPFEDRRDLEFDIADFDFSAADDFYIAINESYRDRKKKSNIERFEIHGFKKSKGYEKEIIKIDLTGNEMINCQMMINQDNTMHLVGLYSGLRKSGRPLKKLRGVYSINIDLNTNEVKRSNFNEFDYETKVKLIGKRRAKKGKDVKPDYVVHSVIEKEDGGLIMLSEYRTIFYGRTQGIGPLGIQPIIYQYNEMIVTSLKPDGTVAWSKVVPKEQKVGVSVVGLALGGAAQSGGLTVSAGLFLPLGVLGKGPEYISVIPIYKNGKLTILFNDNRKNKGITDIDEIKKLGSYNKAVPTAFVFDENGNVERIDTVEDAKDRLVIRPGVFYRVNDSEYIIYASKRKKDKLGRMFIED